MSYVFDEGLAPWVAMLPGIDFTDPVAARVAAGEAMRKMPAPELPETVVIRDVSVPGPTGAPDVPVRIYTPTDKPGPLPALVYFHGGGMILGGLDIGHAGLAELAADVGVVVVSVDYRLAPECPFPSGLEDCYAALIWTVESADKLRIDSSRIAIGGESAGANLAAAVALLNRDRRGPALKLQWLSVPMVDDCQETSSMRDFTDTPMLTRSHVVQCWKHYQATGTVVNGEDWLQYAAPACAGDHSGLPPAYVDVCEFDPLRDAGLDYAARLVRAGVSTEVHLYPGTFHGCSVIRGVPIVERIIADQHAALRRALHPEG